MSRAAGLSEHEAGILASAMGDASCASVLGRSMAWVRRHRAAMAERADAVEVLPVTAKPLTTLEQRRPNAVRYIRRFHAANWSLREIGYLFDVSTEDLAEVLL